MKNRYHDELLKAAIELSKTKRKLSKLAKLAIKEEIKLSGNKGLCGQYHWPVKYKDTVKIAYNNTGEVHLVNKEISLKITFEPIHF